MQDERWLFLTGACIHRHFCGILKKTTKMAIWLALTNNLSNYFASIYTNVLDIGIADYT
jgi:hypothetical protein